MSSPHTRFIILDTETTGLSPSLGHRIIEIGALEMIHRRLTGAVFHTYLNPERAVDPEAERVHGLSTDFLQDKPLFADKAREFIDFIAGASLIIHNAPFDCGFLNHELQNLEGKRKKTDPFLCLEDKHPIIDTLLLARLKHPGQKNNLDALCKRYNIDIQHRHYHGALKDAELLTEVYLALTRSQKSFFTEETERAEQAIHSAQGTEPLCPAFPARPPSSEDLERHTLYQQRFLS